MAKRKVDNTSNIYIYTSKQHLHVLIINWTPIFVYFFTIMDEIWSCKYFGILEGFSNNPFSVRWPFPMWKPLCYAIDVSTWLILMPEAKLKCIFKFDMAPFRMGKNLFLFSGKSLNRSPTDKCTTACSVCRLCFFRPSTHGARHLHKQISPVICF